MHKGVDGHMIPPEALLGRREIWISPQGLLKVPLCHGHVARMVQRLSSEGQHLWSIPIPLHCHAAGLCNGLRGPLQRYQAFAPACSSPPQGHCDELVPGPSSQRLKRIKDEMAGCKATNTEWAANLGLHAACRPGMAQYLPQMTPPCIGRPELENL